MKKTRQGVRDLGSTKRKKPDISFCLHDWGPWKTAYGSYGMLRKSTRKCHLCDEIDREEEYGYDDYLPRR